MSKALKSTSNVVNENMIEFKTKSIATFVKIFEILESVGGDYIKMVFKKYDEDENETDEHDKKKKTHDGFIMIQAFNKNMTVLCNIKLLNILFTSFKIINMEDNIYVCDLELEDFNKFLKSLDQDNHELMLAIKNIGSNEILIKSQHLTEKETYSSYIQPFVMGDSKKIISNKKCEYEYAIETTTVFFKKLCKDINEFSQSMTIKCNSQRIAFEYKTKHNKVNARSYENSDKFSISKLETKIKNKKHNSENDSDDDNDNDNDNDEKDSVASYFIKPLTELKFPPKICGNVQLNLKTNDSLRMSIEIYDGDDECGKMWFLVASQFGSTFSDSTYHNDTKNMY